MKRRSFHELKKSSAQSPRLGRPPNEETQMNTLLRRELDQALRRRRSIRVDSDNATYLPAQVVAVRHDGSGGWAMVPAAKHHRHGICPGRPEFQLRDFHTHLYPKNVNSALSRRRGRYRKRSRIRRRFHLRRRYGAVGRSGRVTGGRRLLKEITIKRLHRVSTLVLGYGAT